MNIELRGFTGLLGNR